MGLFAFQLQDCLSEGSQEGGGCHTAPCPLSPVHQRQAGAWRRAGSGASETSVVQTSHPTEGISEVVLIPADDNLA